MASPKRAAEEGRKVLQKRVSYLLRLLREEAPIAMIAECVAQVMYAMAKIIGKKELRRIIAAVFKDENLRKARLCTLCATHEVVTGKVICQECDDRDPRELLRKIEIEGFMKEPTKGQRVH